MTYFPNEILLKIFSYCDDIKERKQKKNHNTLMKELIEMVNESKEHYLLHINEYNGKYPEIEKLIWYYYMLDDYYPYF